MTIKTIFYVGNFDKPDGNAAGKRVYGVALILAKLGYRVVMIGKRKKCDVQSFPIHYEKNIVYYAFSHANIINTSVYLNDIYQIIKREGEPLFVIRYGSPGLSFFDQSLLSFCRKRNIKMIADVVDWLPPSGNNLFFCCVKTIDTYLEKAVYNKKSDGIIAISSYLSDYYSKSGCKTIIIPPLVGGYQKNEGINGSVRIVYAGVPFRLGRVVKNSKEVKDRLDLAISAICCLDKLKVNLVMDIYGITVEQYLTAYPEQKSMIENNMDRIYFYGHKPMNEVQSAVQKADFTILLRDKNRATMSGFPTKVVESLSLGTPVITTLTSDLGKYIIDGKTGFIVDITDEKTLVHQLEEICTLPLKKITEMKRMCYENCDFCAENFTEEIKTFISEILK